MAHEGRLWRRHTTLYAHVACGEFGLLIPFVRTRPLPDGSVWRAHADHQLVHTRLLPLFYKMCMLTHLYAPPDHRHRPLLLHLGRGREPPPHARVLVLPVPQDARELREERRVREAD